MQTVKLLKEYGNNKIGEVVTVENNEAFRLIDNDMAEKYNSNNPMKSTFNKMMPSKQIRKRRYVNNNNSFKE
ncbi:MAG: hypothetical protein KAT66_00730 [Candidatus Lokiarchaeota archaeon]|nr:hypothetical protein [Candidatus Lokiarchaeota archaeon]